MCLGKDAMGQVGADGAERTSCENVPRGIETRRRDDPCLAALQCSNGWVGAGGMCKGKRDGKEDGVEWNGSNQKAKGTIASRNRVRFDQSATSRKRVAVVVPRTWIPSQGIAPHAAVHPSSITPRSHSSQSMSLLTFGVGLVVADASLSQERVRRVLVVFLSLGLPRQSGRGYNINSTPQRGDFGSHPSRLSLGRTLTTTCAARRMLLFCSSRGSSSPTAPPCGSPLVTTIRFRGKGSQECHLVPTRAHPLLFLFRRGWTPVAFNGRG